MFKAVYQEIRGLHEAAYILAIFTFGSQLLALIRDRLFANHFGASRELDLYYAAFRIPDLLFVIFGSILSVYVLIPFIAERIKEGGDSAGRELLSQVFTIFLYLYGTLAFCILILAPYLVSLFFPGFTASEQVQLALLLRILLVQPFLLSISNLFGVVSQLRSRFVIYAISPIVYNLGIIVGIVFFYPVFGISGLVWGVVLGAIIHLCIQLPLFFEPTLQPRISHSFDMHMLYRILRTSVPRALTLSLHQIVLLVFAGIASALAVGSVSIFQFAYNLQSVPLAIIGVSYSVAAFPTLSRMFSNGEKDQFVAYVASALRHIFFWSIPILAIVIVTRAQLVRIILGSGAFDWDATRLTAAALALFVLSLAAQSVNLLIIRAFYAGGNTRTPLSVTMISAGGALIAGFSLLMTFEVSTSLSTFVTSILRVSNTEGADILMLPLGYSFALIGHSIVLLAIFMKQYGMPFSMFAGSLWRAFCGGIVGGISSYVILNTLVLAISNDTFIGIFLQGASAGIVGLLMTILTLILLKSPELTEVWRALHARIKKPTIVAPQQSDDLTA